MDKDRPWPETPPQGPLAGIRVVELASFISGPFAAMMLADLGADVVKVEPPRGDAFRRFGRPSTAISPVFANTNRNKRSVALDLKSESGREALGILVGDADILICNWRPSVAARLGLDDDVLAGMNPLLIRAYIDGLGPDGPDADQPVFDSIVQARSGMTHTNDAGPTLAPSYLADKVAAAMASQAILAALVQRGRDRVGRRVTISMLDATCYMNFPDVFARRTFVDLDQPVEARNRMLGAVRRPLRASDGWLVVTPVTADQIRRACTAVGHEAWGIELLEITDPEELATEFAKRIESVTVTSGLDHWCRTFARYDVPAAACLTIDEHLADPQVVHNEIYGVSEWPAFGRVRHVRYPASFDSPLPAALPPPIIGEHNAQFFVDEE